MTVVFLSIHPERSPSSTPQSRQCGRLTYLFHSFLVFVNFFHKPYLLLKKNIGFEIWDSLKMNFSLVNKGPLITFHKHFIWISAFFWYPHFKFCRQMLLIYEIFLVDLFQFLSRGKFQDSVIFFKHYSVAILLFCPTPWTIGQYAGLLVRMREQTPTRHIIPVYE